MTNIININYMMLLMSIMEVMIIIVPMLIGVAYLTLGERKFLAILQKRVGPMAVGIFGLLQPFSDAAKLLMKESIIPSQASRMLYYIAPMLTLILSLIGWAVMPFGSGLMLMEWSYSILYTLALSSLGIYGILLAGWSANSKYSFLGSLRATAQMISYELVLSTLILQIVMMCQSFDYTLLVETQQNMWNALPLLPTIMLVFMCLLAETNRTPFDLAEGESELVGGFFTEYSGMIFVMFFLGEYNSIMLMSAFMQYMYFGGYNLMWDNMDWLMFMNWQSLMLGLKIALVTMMFILVRATLPRLRYDQLMYINWTKFLPGVIAFLSLYMMYYIFSSHININMDSNFNLNLNFNELYTYYISNIKN